MSNREITLKLDEQLALWLKLLLQTFQITDDEMSISQMGIAKDKCQIIIDKIIEQNIKAKVQMGYI